MPTYDYGCDKCENEKEVFHGMNETPHIICDCGEKMNKRISKGVQFILKGANWSGKNLREKNHRERRRKEVGRKMALNHDIPQVQPNYKGEICRSWDDAKKLAKSDGIDGNRYDQQVQNLKKEENRVKNKVSNLIKGEG